MAEAIVKRDTLVTSRSVEKEQWQQMTIK
jgi:hypothetical protein